MNRKKVARKTGLRTVQTNSLSIPYLIVAPQTPVSHAAGGLLRSR